MNSKPLQFTLIGIIASTTAASTTTLGLHIWAPPAFSVTLEIPFALGGVTFIGVVLVAATSLSSSTVKPSNEQRAEEIRPVEQHRVEVTQTTPAATPVEPTSVSTPSSATANASTTTSVPNAAAAPLQFPQPTVFYRLNTRLVTMDDGCGLGNIVIIPEAERQTLSIPAGRRVSMRELFALKGWQEAESEQVATATVNLFQRHGYGRGGLVNHCGANNLAGENKINVIIKERDATHASVTTLYPPGSEPLNIPPDLSMDSIFAYEAEGNTGIGAEEQNRTLTPMYDALTRMLSFMDGIERGQNTTAIASPTVVSTSSTSNTVSTTSTSPLAQVVVAPSVLTALEAQIQAGEISQTV